MMNENKKFREILKKKTQNDFQLKAASTTERQNCEHGTSLNNSRNPFNRR